MSNYKTYGEWCAEIKPDDPRSEILNSWRQSAHALNKRLESKQAILEARAEKAEAMVMDLIDAFSRQDWFKWNNLISGVLEEKAREKWAN